MDWLIEVLAAEDQEVHLDEAIFKAKEDGAKNMEECIAWMNGYIRAQNEIMERIGK